jgi:MFS family permease
LGPVLGGVLVALGGYPLLFEVLTGLALVVACWAALAVPRVPPLPRARQTVLDLARRLSQPAFLLPTIALAATTGALSAGVGFLPVLGARSGLGPVVTGAAVSLLAVSTALTQPLVGRARDADRVGDRVGMALGLTVTAAGLAIPVLLPGIAGLLTAAVTTGVGVGLVTPLAFAVLASTGPPERTGQTMGSAEVGRELGDAGGPLLVGAVAVPFALTGGLLGLAGVVAVTAVLVGRSRPRVQP